MSGTSAPETAPHPDGDGEPGHGAVVVELPAERVAVDVRIAWIPLERGSREGQVVVHRTVRTSIDDRSPAEVDDMWLSEPMRTSDLLDVTAVGGAPWTDLLVGRPVRELPGPPRLHEADDGELRRLASLLERTGGAGQRVFAAASAVAEDTETKRLALTALSAAHAPRDLLAQPFAETLVPQDLHRVDDPAGPWPEEGPACLEYRPIELRDVRAAQSSQGNVLVNVFVADDRPDVDLRRALGADDVTRAIERLQKEPGNPLLRTELVAALEHEGGTFLARSQAVEVGRHGGLIQWLWGLVSFVVASEAGREHLGDDVYYRTSTPTGSALLRENPRLAAAVTDQLVLPPGGGRSVAALRVEIADAVSALPIEWTDGRQHDVPASPGMLPNLVRVVHKRLPAGG